jgi:hypothetical protein
VTFTARTFARDKNGELLKFEANDVESYDQAIAMVKEAAGVDRALCVVDKNPKVTTAPIEYEEQENAA